MTAICEWFRHQNDTSSDLSRKRSLLHSTPCGKKVPEGLLSSCSMKLLKNVKVIVVLILTLAAIGVVIGVRSHVPSSEISRTEMLQFLEKKLIARASVTPLVYQSIYNIEGSYTPTAGG